MNKIKKLIVLLIIINNITYANSGEDHLKHDHDNQIKAEKKNEHSENNIDDHAHDSHGEDNHEAEHKGHDSHEGGKSIGKGKAIEAVDEIKGFKLSKEAIKTLGIKLKTVDAEKFLISKATLIVSKSNKGIYRFREGYFKFLPVTSIRKVKGKYLVNVKGVGFGDQVVIDGLGLLQVTDVYSTDKSEYGHGH